MTETSRMDISGWTIRWNAERTERLRQSGWWTGKTVADYAEDWLRKAPDKVLVVDREREHTVRQIWDEASALARALTARGLKPGDTISFMLPNWAESLAINLAAAMAGLVVNPIIPIYRDAETEFMLRDCRSKLIFLPREFRGYDYVAMIERVMTKLAAPIDVVVARGDAGAHIAYEALVASAPTEAALTRAKPDAVKLVMYTSGTTGRAKGVLHTHESLQAENVARIRHLGLTDKDIWFSPSPVTHVTGYLYSLVLPFMTGLTTVMLDVWDAETGFDMMSRRRCTGTVAATIFLQQLVGVAKRRGDALPALRYFVCGGAQVPPDLIREAARTFVNCAPSRIYGSTEMPCITAGVNSRALLDKGAETDGELCFGEARIADPQTDAPVAEGGEGEILAFAPQMFVGYAREEDNQDAFDADGFFRMGDLGRLVDGRFIVVTGRKKDIIIRAGENISPKEVEDLLLNHPDIADVSIVAMPDERTGEAACAFVIARGARPVNLASVREFLVRTGIAMQKIPERVELLPEFPRTAVGKVRKDILRERAKGLRKEAPAPKRSSHA